MLWYEVTKILALINKRHDEMKSEINRVLKALEKAQFEQNERTAALEDRIRKLETESPRSQVVEKQQQIAKNQTDRQ